MPQAVIRICQDDHSWQAELIPAGTIIGRSEECDIVISSSHVSRRHARIFLTCDGEWFVAELAKAETLYPEVCRLLAQDPKTATAVFRVPSAGLAAPTVPAVMACHFGSSPEDVRAESGSRCPSHLAFRVSHRLLETVRKDGHPLMTKSIFSCDTQVTLSLIDEHSPRALICASLGTTGQAVDLLYVDVPIDDRSRPSAEEVFAFIQAVAQLISQRNDA